MSRSEHATRRDRRDPGDLARKRRVKWLVAERSRAPRDLPERTRDEAAAGVPIVVAPGARYPASADDLRALLARLPPGTADGLGGIELCPPEEPDHEVLPGVTCGDVLGTYHHGTRSDITLHGYLYDEDIADRDVVEAYLRVRMLSTFVHELGHHHDWRERVARGRWRLDDDDAAEIHAEAVQHAWTLDHVIPYVEEAHGESLAALERWLVEHGGVRLSVAALLGDPRTTGDRSGETGEQRFFAVRSAFASLFEHVRAGARPPDLQLDFARELHYGAWYDEALAVLDAVARDHPCDREQTLRADILVHLGRHDEARALVEPLLVRSPDDADALEVLADVEVTAGAWARARELAVRRAAVAEGWQRDASLREAVRAAIELAAWDDVDRELAGLRAAAATRFDEQRIAELDALAQLRRGRPAEALALVEGVGGLLAIAVAADAAHLAGISRPRHARLDFAIAYLRANGCADWADRLSVLP